MKKVDRALLGRGLLRIASALCVVATTCGAVAGERGPGPYRGIVFSDRWASCVLYRGVYVERIAGSLEERVSPYVGRDVRLDATEV